MAPPGAVGRGVPRWLWAILAVALVTAATFGVLASGALGRTSAPPPAVYTMTGYSVSFSGNASADFQVVGACAGPCGTAAPGGTITVVVTIAPIDFSCANADQFEIASASLPAGQVFHLASVGAATTTNPSPLPTFVPNELGSICDPHAQLDLVVLVEPAGPADSALALTVTVSDVRA